MSCSPAACGRGAGCKSLKCLCTRQFICHSITLTCGTPADLQGLGMATLDEDAAQHSGAMCTAAAAATTAWCAAAEEGSCTPLCSVHHHCGPSSELSALQHLPSFRCCSRGVLTLRAECTECLLVRQGDVCASCKGRVKWPPNQGTRSSSDTCSSARTMPMSPGHVCIFTLLCGTRSLMAMESHGACMH